MAEPAPVPAPESVPESVRRPRPWWAVALRWLFVVVVCGFAALGVRGSWDEVRAAMADVAPARVALALGCVLLGLLVTGVLWRTILRAAGFVTPARPALSVFFTGQLGKYVPGSVWSVGMQADLARDLGVPVRITVHTSLMFLWVHVASGLLVGGVGATLADPLVDVPRAAWLAPALVGAACLAPPVLATIARRLAGPAHEVRPSAADAVRWTALMAPAWAAYAVALVLLVPDPRPGLLAVLLAAFALGYVAGVVVPFLPAGVGAREVVMVGLLAPTVGLGAASAVAVLARLVHTVADFVAAGVARAARG